MSCFQNLFSSVQSAALELPQAILPTAVNSVVQAGLQDPRIGRIVGGVVLAGSGIQMMAASGIPAKLRAKLAGRAEGNGSNSTWRWTAAAMGLSAACYGIYSVVSGAIECMVPEQLACQLPRNPETVADKQPICFYDRSERPVCVSDRREIETCKAGTVETCRAIPADQRAIQLPVSPRPIEKNPFYLVVHDNKKPMQPRLAIVNAETGAYTKLELNQDSPLANAKDLESLQQIRGNEYLACESSGNCFHFALEKDGQEQYSAEIGGEIKLPLPSGKYSNIEGVALNPQKREICWSHRGGSNPGEEAWTRCAPVDLEAHKVGDFVESSAENPFAKPGPFDRPIADAAFNPKTGRLAYVASIDTETPWTNPETKANTSSIVYDANGCLVNIPGHKVEGLYIHSDGEMILGTDNEDAGSDICRYSSLSKTLKCVEVMKGQPYGISGIVPLEISQKKISKEELAVRLAKIINPSVDIASEKLLVEMPQV